MGTLFLSIASISMSIAIGDWIDTRSNVAVDMICLSHMLQLIGHALLPVLQSIGLAWLMCVANMQQLKGLVVCMFYSW